MSRKTLLLEPPKIPWELIWDSRDPVPDPVLFDDLQDDMSWHSEEWLAGYGAYWLGFPRGSGLRQLWVYGWEEAYNLDMKRKEASNG
jgi:hypothetical protein